MIYKVPSETKDKEKIIGGIIDLTQFFWLLGGIGIMTGIFLLIYAITKLPILALILSLPALGVSGAFMFVRKYEKTMSLFQFFKLKIETKTKNKRLINKRLINKRL